MSLERDRYCVTTSLERDHGVTTSLDRDRRGVRLRGAERMRSNPNSISGTVHG